MLDEDCIFILVVVMKFCEMHNLISGELEGLLGSLRKDLFSAKLKSKMMEKKSLLNLRSKKRDVARILTILSLRLKGCIDDER